ncbi:MAG: Serine/arginine repetitive matrix protein 1 [Piccolia ochrophora]|nr:MAG: Serine/arginine repetitive matrix protein 1 [Piccolia ochrophora]
MATTVDMKMLKQTKFPPEFNQKVDMQKVNLEVMKRWIAGKISEILGNEDDIVIELCFNLLEGSRYPDVKKLQISLTGFLDKDTPRFCKELWNLCLSAQSNAQGVPKELLEAKKLELIQEKLRKSFVVGESKRRPGRLISPMYDSASKSIATVTLVADDLRETVGILIDRFDEIRDLLLDAATLRIDRSFVDLRPGGTWTPTFPEPVMAKLIATAAVQDHPQELDMTVGGTEVYRVVITVDAPLKTTTKAISITLAVTQPRSTIEA